MTFWQRVKAFFSNYADQHNPQKFGVVRIYMGERGGDLATYYTDLFERQCVVLGALGPKFVRWHERGTAHVTVQHWDSTEKGDPQGAGIYSHDNRLIGFDPTGCRGPLEIQTVFGHEIGHFLGMKHIRKDRLDPDADYSPVGPGEAMMNRSVNRDGSPEIGFETYQGKLPNVRPTKWDVEEFNRVWNGVPYGF